MADQKFTIDVSQAIAQLQGVDRALSGLGDKIEETANKAQDVFADSQGAIREAKAIDNLKNNYRELTDAVKTLKQAQKNAQDPRAIKAFADEIKKGEATLRRYEDAAKSAGVSLKNISNTGNTTKEVFEGLVGTVTKATIILAVINETAAALKSVFDFSETIKRSELQFANFTGSAEAASKQVGELVDFANRKFLNTEEVLSAGKALLAFGISAEDLEVSLSDIADISAGTGKNFEELAVIYGKARTAGVLYAEDINQLVDAGIPIIKEFAKQLGVSEAEVKKLASEGRISFEELQLAFANLTAQGEKFAGQAEAQANTFSGVWRKVGSQLLEAFKPVGDLLGQIGTDIGKAVNVYISNIQRVSGDANSGFIDRVKSFFPSLTDLALEQNRIAIEAAKSQTKEQSEEAERRIELERQAEEKRLALAKEAAGKKAAQRAAERKKELEEERKFQEEKTKFETSLLPEGEDRELALAKQRYEANLEAAKKYGVDRALVEEQYQQEILEIIEKYAGLDAQKVADDNKRRLDEERKGLEVSKQIAEIQIQIEEQKYKAAIDSLKGQGVDEERIRQAQAAADVRIQRLRLEAQINFEQQRLEVLQASGDQQAAAVAKNIELLQAQLSNLPSTFTPPDIEPGQGGEGRNIFDILGINLDDQEQGVLLEALGKATAAVVGSIQEISAARVQAAQEAVSAAESQVQAAEDALKKEEDLAAQGFANNASLRRRELEEAKLQRDKAIEEQRKAQRQQILLDAALQASSLASTVANLFKSLSVLPFGSGVPIAIALSATMFAAFAKAKADALRATRARYGLDAIVGKDGLVKGKAHSMGGNKLEIERGEFFSVGSDGKRDRLSVVRKERTAEYWDLLDAANRNDKTALAKSAFQLAGLDYPGIITPEIKMKKIDARHKADKAGTPAVNITQVQGGDKKQAELLRSILSEMRQQNASEKWTPDGKTRTKGNTKTRYI